MHVLLIDDDPDLADLLSICLEMQWPSAKVFTAKGSTRG